MQPDPYWLTEGQEVQVDVPIQAVEEYGGATRTPDGLHFQPTAGPLPSADLWWGKFRLGRFVLDTVEGRFGRADRHPHYLATLRRMEQPPEGVIIPAEPEPVDDAFALWIKRKRDSHDGPTTGHIDEAWYVLDGLLDDYRDHRVTGTPLDQEVEGPHGEDQ